MVRVWLGKSLGTVDLTTLGSRSFHELLNYVASGEVDLNEVRKLVEKVNEDLKVRGLRIQVRKASPWDKKVDYRLVLRLI